MKTYIFYAGIIHVGTEYERENKQQIFTPSLYGLVTGIGIAE